jgi:hypothetical protein
MSMRIGLFVAAAFLLGAHFLRAGNFLLVILCLATPLLFLQRNRWSLIILQVAAYCASAIWLSTALQLIEHRQRVGQPWTAATVILGMVGVLTLAAGLLLNSRCMRVRYFSRPHDPSGPDTSEPGTME